MSEVETLFNFNSNNRLINFNYNYYILFMLLNWPNRNSEFGFYTIFHLSYTLFTCAHARTHACVRTHTIWLELHTHIHHLIRISEVIFFFWWNIDDMFMNYENHQSQALILNNELHLKQFRKIYLHMNNWKKRFSSYYTISFLNHY